MSSAILYVAIVAIWAGVLIPRWLRRDPAATERAVEDTSTPADAPAQEPPGPPRQREDGAQQARPEGRPVAAEARPARPGDSRPGDSRPEAGRRPAPRDQEHRRVLSARRRLLGLLMVLTIGSGALAFTRTAAWWVVVPPSVMLLGYMALLREASKADAERRELARSRAAEVTAKPAAPAVPVPAPAPVPAPVPVPAPDAEIIEISAGQGRPDEKFYDQYADAKLRAVGD